MRQLFISYARENRPEVEPLRRDLDALGYQAWMDTSLRGGQSWWNEIMRRIAESDAFVTIVSDHMLNSQACKRELEWAEALNKPVLPLAVGRLPDALPRSLSMRHIVNYSRPDREAAIELAGALGSLPAAPAPPQPMPEPPPAPLSYLSDLVEQVGQPEPLTQRQQHEIVMQLQPALRSSDSEERRGGHYVLEMFSKRQDLYADVDRSVAQLVGTSREAQSPSDDGSAQDGADERASIVPEVAAATGADLRDDLAWSDALDAFFNDRWAEAVERFETLQRRYPGDVRVETRLEDARRRLEIETWSQKAATAANDEDWDTAVTALENLTSLNPTDPDTSTRLEHARDAQRRKALVDEMTTLYQARRWEAVVVAGQELARVDPENPDPGGIVSSAQNEILNAELAAQYGKALGLFEQDDWQNAADMFAAIEHERPGYREAAALAKRAERHRDIAAWSDQAAAAAERSDWDTAVVALQKICAIDPRYLDASTRLEQARTAQRRQSPGDEAAEATTESGESEPKASRSKLVIGVAVALAVAASTTAVLVVASSHDQAHDEPTPTDEWLNHAAVGTCFVVQPNQVVLSRSCFDSQVLRVTKVTNSSANCEAVSAEGYFQADDTGRVLCWSTTPG